MINKDTQYLGDGVYVTIENGMLKLMTSNGLEITNTIYLEPAVLLDLFDYYKKILSLNQIQKYA